MPSTPHQMTILVFSHLFNRHDDRLGIQAALDQCDVVVSANGSDIDKHLLQLRNSFAFGLHIGHTRDRSGGDCRRRARGAHGSTRNPRGNARCAIWGHARPRRFPHPTPRVGSCWHQPCRCVTTSTRRALLNGPHFTFTKSTFRRDVRMHGESYTGTIL